MLPLRRIERTSGGVVAAAEPPAKTSEGFWANARTLLEALRPQHWIKNLLVFLPLVAAHRFLDVALLARSAEAFVAFTLCASSVYLMNDVVDVQLDRAHPHKRLRPLASGRLSIRQTTLALCVTFLAAMAATLPLPGAFMAAMAAYVALMVIYSFGAKLIPIVDVLILAAGYALRVAAGSIAARVALSGWLLAFCMFLFFSLALVKRYAELRIRADRESGYVLGYFSGDGALILAQGCASGYIAVLVLALYTTSKMAQDLSGRYQLFWLVCLLLFYCLSRLWLMAHRGRIQGDPVAYALGDPVSGLLILGTGLICLAAT